MATDRTASRNEMSDLAAIIRQLGGPTVVGRHFGITCEAICMWTQAGKVPAAQWTTFWRLCTTRGIAWTPPGCEHLRLVEAEPPASEVANRNATTSTHATGEGIAA